MVVLTSGKKQEQNGRGEEAGDCRVERLSCYCQQNSHSGQARWERKYWEEMKTPVITSRRRAFWAMDVTSAKGTGACMSAVLEEE